MSSNQPYRDTLARVLDWQDAHANYDSAVQDFPEVLRGVRPPGIPHSGWELAEHLRITQRDILDFCVADSYQELRWPEQYWPDSPEPPNAAAWEKSIAGYRADRARVRSLTLNPAIDLAAVVPHGTDQTYLREVLLIIDHAAYHVAQLVLVRRALNAWSVR
jgi:DinB family protein